MYHTQAKTHIQKEGLPRFYIRTLAELEDCLDVALKDKEAQKKMSKANGRALNRMKLQLRRHLCGNQPVCRVHFSAMTRPCWPRRAVRSRHRHAIEQASRR